MRTLSISTVLLSAVSLSACVSATSTPSFDQEYTRYTPLAADVGEIVCLETTVNSGGEIVCSKANNTLYTNLPETDEIDIARYSGLLLSIDHYCVGNDTKCDEKEGYSGPLVEFIAKLDLEVNFDTQEATGSLSDFVTRLPGFKNPVGVIKLTGKVCDTEYCVDGGSDGFAYLSFWSEEGPDNILRGDDGIAARFWFREGSPNGWDLGADGAFGGNSGILGTNGQVLAGTFGSDFEWIGAIFLNSTSGSDGNWVAIIQ